VRKKGEVMNSVKQIKLSTMFFALVGAFGASCFVTAEGVKFKLTDGSEVISKYEFDQFKEIIDPSIATIMDHDLKELGRISLESVPKDGFDWIIKNLSIVKEGKQKVNLGLKALFNQKKYQLITGILYAGIYFDIKAISENAASFVSQIFYKVIGENKTIALKSILKLNRTYKSMELLNQRTLDMELYSKDPGIVQILITYGADPNVQLWEGTPLLHAIYYPYLDVIKVLLKEGADPNLPWNRVTGVTPLMKAVMNKNIDVVKLLLADNRLDLKGKAADEALDIAERRKSTEIADLIKKAMQK